MMTYEEILNHFKKSDLLNSISNVLNWDMETFMPEKAAGLRGDQLALISGLHYQHLTEPSFVDGLFSLNLKKGSLQDLQIQKLRITVSKLQALNQSLVEALASTQVATIKAWKQARDQDDFNIVAPHLKKTLDLQREKAQGYSSAQTLQSYYGERNHYEVLLDDYEPEMKSSDLKSLLGKLVAGTKERIEHFIEKSPKNTTKIPMPIDKQLELNRKIAADLGFDFNGGRMDTSVHPFCGGHPQDIRITTRYFENDVLEGLTGTIHETGHALYEAGLPREFVSTPCGTSCSMGTHESQSRFYENFIGRSQAFSRYLSGMLNVSAESIHASLNQVQKTFIRVESDEVSYNLHIALRMELEEKMLLQDLSVKELPEAWNQRFQEFFDMKPPSALLGCLQDTHWFGGAFGYFPTYSIGNLMAAELFSDFKSEFSDWESRVERGDFLFVHQFMKERLHQHAAFEGSPQTIRKALKGRPLGVDSFFEYLDEKYS